MVDDRAFDATHLRPTCANFSTRVIPKEVSYRVPMVRSSFEA